MEIFVSKRALPVDNSERATYLDGYFSDLLARAHELEGGWSISISRPTTADYYVDPSLQRGIDWWSRSYGEVSVVDVPVTIAYLPELQISLQDSWTLYGWSKWLEQDNDNKYPNITLLHIDDHDDFMSPRLIVEDPRWKDAITGEQFDLYNSSTVRSSICSAAVGIGSFMAPMLHALSHVDIRHLCATEYASSRKGKYYVRPVLVPDELLAIGQPRPSLQLLEQHQSRSAGMGHPYLATDDLAFWIRDLRAGPILLHIDMDYFCNRFNGSSDWNTAKPRHDPYLPAILSRIDQIFEALEHQNITLRISNCSIAMSPGFFPAELWEPSINRLIGHVKRISAAGRWGVT